MLLTCPQAARRDKHNVKSIARFLHHLIRDPSFRRPDRGAETLLADVRHAGLPDVHELEAALRGDTEVPSKAGG